MYYTDLAKENLQGKVKSVTTIVYRKNAKKRFYEVGRKTYNEHGYQIGYEEIEDVKHLDTSIRFKEIIIRDNTNKKVESFLIELNGCHLLVVERFYYDSLNRKIKHQIYWYKNNAIEDSVTTEYRYREQDNSMLIFYEDGRTEKHIFDHNGNLVEKYEFKDRDQKILEDKYQYQYNEQGKRVRKFHFLEDDIKENIQTQRGEIYVYNDRGDLQKMAVLCGCCSQNENDLIWNEYVYSNFDKQGNWLQKTSKSFGTLVTIRQITYYE